MENFRFGWIEASLRYAGRFGTREKTGYRQLFGISEATVSRDQDRFWPIFEEANSDPIFKKNPDGSLLGRRLVLLENVTLSAVPQFSSMPTPEVWLRTIFSQGKFEQAPAIRAHLDESVLRKLVQGIEDRAALNINYHSRRQESLRRISPHALVWVAGRLHVRAFDHSTNEYRDFVLSRVLRATLLPQQRGHYVDGNEDKDWHRSTDITVQAKLGEIATPSQGVCLEFGLDEHGQKTIRSRDALAPYLADRIGEEFTSPVEVFVSD